jgi:hypothetical protein
MQHEVDQRDKTDRKITMVEAMGFAPKSAKLVEADHLTRQKGHADEAGHHIRTDQPYETERKIWKVEAPVFGSRSATLVEEDLIGKQIEAAVVALKELPEWSWEVRC